MMGILGPAMAKRERGRIDRELSHREGKSRSIDVDQTVKLRTAIAQSHHHRIPRSTDREQSCEL